MAGSVTPVWLHGLATAALGNHRHCHPQATLRSLAKWGYRWQSQADRLAIPLATEKEAS